MNKITLNHYNNSLVKLQTSLNEVNDEITVIKEAMVMAQRFPQYLIGDRHTRTTLVCSVRKDLLERTFLLTKKILNDEGFALTFESESPTYFILSRE
jgi:hypothetical protein